MIMNFEQLAETVNSSEKNKKNNTDGTISAMTGNGNAHTKSDFCEAHRTRRWGSAAFTEVQDHFGTVSSGNNGNSVSSSGDFAVVGAT